MKAKLHGQKFFVGQVMGVLTSNPHQPPPDYATGLMNPSGNAYV